MTPGIVAYYKDPLDRLKWEEVYRDGGFILYDVYHEGEVVASLLFGHGGPNRTYRGINYVNGKTVRSRCLRDIELILAAPFLNPNC